MSISDLGSVTLEAPDTVEAGSLITARLIYTAGHPVDDTGFVKVVFRYAGDFGIPQFDNPAGPNFCSVATTGDCRIEPRWDPKGHTRPWGSALFLKIMGGFLDRGDTVTVVFGDTSQGSPGWRAQTFCEETFELKMLVDPIATYRFKELPVSPTFRIVPGKPVRALCIAPSLVRIGEPFRYRVKTEDRWGNPTALPASVGCPGFGTAGVHAVKGTDPRTGLVAMSNPIEVVPDKPESLPYWADLHGQSEETVGTNSVTDYFRFARDYGCLDAAAHQGNDFQVTDALWETINRTTADFNESGRFVTFPGYEWSGNTPLGGDRNIYFETEGGTIARSCGDLLPGEFTAFPHASTASQLFAQLAAQPGPRAFAFAHVGGRYADLRMHNPEIEIAVEVHSAWGTFEWLLEDAFRLGYRVGVCANSDGHKGRPGSSYPGAAKFGSLGGLTCIRAHSLTRDALLEALRARRFYGTTGARMILHVDLTTHEGHRARMGEIVESAGGAARLRVAVAGTGAIERIDVRNGTKRVRTVRPFAAQDLGHRVKVTWGGATVRGRDRKVQWDGNLTVSGNRILAVQPINFWNPDALPDWHGRNRVTWRSITTGGAAGLILTLAKSDRGTICLDTAQRRVQCALRDLKGAAPRRWRCGGIDKRLEIARLPTESGPSEIAFSMRLKRLSPGDNPVFVRVQQEDGHIAWSSPIYLNCSRTA